MTEAPLNMYGGMQGVFSDGKPYAESYHPKVPERLDDKGFPVGALLIRLVPGRRRAVQLHVGQAAALLGAGDVDVLDVDAVCLLHPADDIPVSGLAVNHALMVTVVVQGHQDAEGPIVQRDNGIRKAKVRTPV